MEYFDIRIEGSAALYQEICENGTITFLDENGRPVEPPKEPIHYVLRSFCVTRPEWMEPLHQEP